mgnify:CR=1 FL=1
MGGVWEGGKVARRLEGVAEVLLLRRPVRLRQLPRAHRLLVHAASAPAARQRRRAAPRDGAAASVLLGARLLRRAR